MFAEPPLGPGAGRRPWLHPARCPDVHPEGLALDQRTPCGLLRFSHVTVPLSGQAVPGAVSRGQPQESVCSPEVLE